MVTIFIMTLDPTGQSRNFSFFAKLEVVLEQLNYLIQNGENVIQAYVVDQQQRLELPLEAFDGQPFLAPLQELEQQWQFILSGPQSADSVQKRYSIELAKTRIRHLETNQTHFERTSERLHSLRQRALERLPEGTNRLNLISHYEQLIAQNELKMTSLKIRYDAARRRLTQLTQSLKP